MAEIVTTSIKSLPLVYRGKVRDSYAVGDDKLLIVASDRISVLTSSSAIRPQERQNSDSFDGLLVQRTRRNRPESSDGH